MKKKALGPSTLVFPLPCVLVSSGIEGKDANISTMSYVSIVNGQPPMLSVSVRPSRRTHALITSHGFFGVNVPTVDILPEVNEAGMISGADEDKFDGLLLTPFSGTVTGVALIAECPIALECRLVKTIDLPTHTLFIGEVVETYADNELFRDNRLMPGPNRFVCYGANSYWTVGTRMAVPRGE